MKVRRRLHYLLSPPDRQSSVPCPMTPSERWPAILLQLDADTWKRAADLARALGVSERTVYRDVQAMVEAGVPLQGVPGKGYRVPEDYLLEPITLTRDEAIMLVLGSAYAAQNFRDRYRAAARSAQWKLDAVLPDEARERAFSLQGSVHLVPPSAFGTVTEDGNLERVRQALVEERTMQVTLGNGADKDPQRLDPYGLVRTGAAWYIVGYNPDLNRVTHLRLQDIEELELTTQTFHRPDSYRAPSKGPERTPVRRVRVLFSAEVTPSVQVAPSVHVAERAYLNDGRMLMTMNVDHELEVLPWLLSWGRHVQVLEPQALRKRIANEARTIAEQYRDVPTLLD